MRFGQERRTAVRVKKYQLIKCRTRGGENAISFVRDISATGMLFCSKVDIPKGELIDVSILSPAEKSPVNIACRVLRSSPLKKFTGFNVGVKFTDMTDADKGYVQRMLRPYKKKA